MQALAAHRKTRYRYSLIILRAMVITDFNLRYQASILGYLWTLLKPLAMFTILYVVFVQLLKIGAAVPFNAIYLLSASSSGRSSPTPRRRVWRRWSSGPTSCARSASRATWWSSR